MSRKLVLKRGTKLGAAPGTLLHIGRHKQVEAAIQLISYGPDELQETLITEPAAHQPGAGPDRVHWLNVDGLADPSVV